MKQVVQPVSGGPVRVVDVPRPVCGPTEVLVQTVASVLSPGTERAVTAMAQSSLLAKAKARPDLVRQVVRKARSEGLRQTSRAVAGRLRGDVPLGYSAAGTVVEVGEYVTGVLPGRLVATGGAGKANHAEVQAVPGLLCAPVPDGVGAEEAAFAAVGSVALHGLRLADVGPGSHVVVIGLGLVGQLAVRAAAASGCRVAAVDVRDFAVSRAGAAGALALLESGEDTTDAVLEWSRGRGADAVVVAASGASSSVIARTPALCRDRATVVVVGDVGLDLDRRPFYDKELALRFARSYGPGRYELSYEGWGVDYPPGYVRWTEGRNLEAFLDLLAGGGLRVDDLVTHRFPVEEAAAAYALVGEQSEPSLGIVLTYDTSSSPEAAVQVRPPPPSAGSGIGLVGAGAFASNVLVPGLRAAGFDRWVAVASASGLSARRLAEQAGFEKAVSGADEVVSDPNVGVVVIATPHDTHASTTVRALRAGKHVWCEKPLAIDMEELEAVEEAWSDSGAVLFVGFNRRYSPAVARACAHFEGAGAGPLVVTYRVNAPAFAPDTWPADRRQGGRLVGEVCHFVDTCAALVGENAVSVEAFGADAAGAADLAVMLRYPGGSVASITVASRGHRSTEKERIEVLGRGHAAVIHDFRRLTLDGTEQRLRAQDKGHRAAAAAFRAATRRGSAEDTPAHLASSRTTLLAAEGILRK